MTGSAAVHLPLLLIAIANIAFVYGMRAATLILVAVFGLAIVILPLWRNVTWPGALAQVPPIAVLATFVLGMASATIRRGGAGRRPRSCSNASGSWRWPRSGPGSRGRCTTRSATSSP